MGRVAPLVDVGVGLQVIARQHVGLGVGSCQDDHRYPSQRIVGLDRGENLATIHLRKVEVEQDNRRDWDFREVTLPVQEAHCLRFRS